MKIYLLAGALCLISAPALASFASLAVSPHSGAWGRSNDKESRDKADNIALGYCQAHARDPSDCRVVTWAKGGWCAAIAVHHKGDGSVVWGSASASTMEAARAKAYANCAGQRGDRCDEILADVCSH